VTYCTQQDLMDRFGEDRLIQLTDRENYPATTINATAVAKHIADASSTIDMYLAKKYQLPLTVEVPAALTKICVDLSWYALQGDTVEKDSAVAVAYRMAMAELGRLASGEVVIKGAAGAELAQAGGGQIKTGAPSRVFTRDSMGEF
jgi:phage gp36-like protein